MNAPSADSVPRKKPNYSKRRAISLVLVHVLFGIHIAHWKLNGTTLAPLELNELMYTLELGIITAGFLFMLTAVLATMFFGRFFCSWGCHILALQDLCHWMLGKIGITPKPVRSRLLLWVPILAVVHMFVWPQISRLREGQPMPALHMNSDVEGWASFMTDDFWRNLPPVWVALMTFLVVGFIAVYFLGSRSFCTYGCPYGAIFGWADRLAPGRIRVNDNCKECGKCTAACTSNIQVLKEFQEYGNVVNPACLKDLDCIEACPNDAAHYGFGNPSMASAVGPKARFRVPFDFSWPEEILMACVMLSTVFIFRGLYNVGPFLMTLGLGAIFAFMAITTIRLFTKPNVRFSKWVLRKGGRLQRSGVGFGLISLLCLSFSVHSGVVRYHEAQGWASVKLLETTDDDMQARVAAQDAWQHLELVDRIGLLHPMELQTGLLRLSAMLGKQHEVRRYAALVSEQLWDEAAMLAELGGYRGAAGDVQGGIRDLQRALELEPGNALFQAELNQLLAVQSQ
ncbi:MAG: 4Fe-4S binding protein [Planctomycetes bacterium]|nr:4Fe-4S binding protein [Planctomycetota bacterium]MCP4770641.1 4Fe-4S binding protein [Planctomycetota bacterium]MCP4861032.1 4Fe-4S binding protein [Planctomycetota bacterium]